MSSIMVGPGVDSARWGETIGGSAGAGAIAGTASGGDGGVSSATACARMMASVIVKTPTIPPTRRGRSGSAELVGDQLRHGLQGVIEPGGVVSAGLREIRPAAALAAHHLSDFADELARTDDLGNGRSDARDQHHFAVGGAAQ